MQFVDGLEDALANIVRLVALLEDPDTISLVFLPSAEAIRDGAKLIAPRRTGKLAEHIFATRGAESAKDVIVGVDVNQVPYAHIVEALHPYLRPAADAEEGRIPGDVAARLRTLIEAAVP